MLKPLQITSILAICFVALVSCQSENNSKLQLHPAKNASNVNPDTQLRISFDTIPEIGNAGFIRVYDHLNDSLVDELDLSIPAGPTVRYSGPKAPYTPEPYEYKTTNYTNANTKPGTPSGLAEPTPDNYQISIIGRFTDGFHFYPILINDNTVTIALHHNLLEYNKKYYVEIDSGVLNLPDQSFTGLKGKNAWSFATKKQQPELSQDSLVVSPDGTGDFSTIQGAMDFIPDFSDKSRTILIKNGVYEEIVYFRNKSNVKIVGESRDSVVVRYANREVLNPHPSNISTNEWPGTFPSRRSVFMADNSNQITIQNLTIFNTTEKGQAEGLLINGTENQVIDVTIIGSGDALQSNGSCFYKNCTIKGWGDTILGRGPAFFKDCRLISIGPFMYIRNTAENHGNVFVNCIFETPGDAETVLARSPGNNGEGYPYAEAVLINCQIAGLKSVGWGPVGKNTENMRYWEYNSTHLNTGELVDVSQRHPASRQLKMPTDSALITNYQNPAFVLGGWLPESHSEN